MALINLPSSVFALIMTLSCDNPQTKPRRDLDHSSRFYARLFALSLAATSETKAA
jgi:hypothetical protein